ncbi:MAG: hypothetical protein AB7T06_09045 [Kofleriaceae bacterium]
MPLPPQGRLWRRMWAHPRLMHFHRLMALVVLGNVALVIALGHLPWTGAPRAAIATLTSLVVGNLGLAIIVRQQYVINLLFWLATRAPTSWPLWIRATLAKVYHFGGLHVGGAIAATAWYAALVYVVLAHGGASTAATTIAIVQLVLLVAIATISMPQFRARHHDTFEIVKRFGGWASLILFWAHAVVFARDELAPGASLAYALVTSWQTWVLAAATLSVALPWMRLRKVPVELVVPSKHVALARFDYGVTPFAGSSTAISRSPLREWHSFANVPWPDRPGYRLTISRAGDWTGALIDDKPSHVWVKGIPTAGVANIEVLFKRVVYVATGSGIGPCLPHLLAQKVPASLVWATRDPRATYGDELVDEILAVQPDAQIIDTHKQGKPDLVALAYQAAVATGAEAVICISNKKLTWEVVYGLESRGIPAYGAIWDS